MTLVEPDRRHTFCRLTVDALPPADLVELFAAGVASARRVVVGHHNLHGLSLLDEDPWFRRFFGLVDATFVDGISLVVLGRLAGAPLARSDRATVLDWIWLLFDRAEREGWRVVHVGGRPPVIGTAHRAITGRHPGLDLVTLDGFFDPTPGHPENVATLAAIEAAAPQVLLVGMGMPRQERWIAENFESLPECVIVTVGGILGYLGEDRATPPRWTGRLGLEWLARLVSEPRRLAHRYLVEPLPLVPRLAARVVRERLRASRPVAPPPSGPAGAGEGRLRVLYIGGEGRSGTTLLDQMLGQLPGVASTGELFAIWEHGVLDDDRCGCGAPFSACPVWTAVGDRGFGGWSPATAAHLHDIRRRLVRDRYFPWLLGRRAWRGRPQEGDLLVATLDRLYRTILEVTGAEVLVDSSKFVGYAMALARVHEIDLRVVQLVRDARGAAHSWTKEVKKPEVAAGEVYMDRYPPVHTAARWQKTDWLFASLRARSVPVMTLRYEDLVADPRSALRRVVEFGELPVGPQAFDRFGAAQVELAPTHTVAGNPSRFRTGRVDLRLDEDWRREMPKVQQLLVTLLAGPGLARHGYLRRTG